MSITAVVTGAVLMGTGSLRWSLLPVRTITGPGEQFRGQDMPVDAFMTDMGVQNAAGDRFVFPQCLPDRMPGAYCPTDLEVTNWYVDFHPYAHFWYVQLIETGIVLALTAGAACAAFRVLRRLAA